MQVSLLMPKMFNPENRGHRISMSVQWFLARNHFGVVAQLGGASCEFSITVGSGNFGAKKFWCQVNSSRSCSLNHSWIVSVVWWSTLFCWQWLLLTGSTIWSVAWFATMFSWLLLGKVTYACSTSWTQGPKFPSRTFHCNDIINVSCFTCHFFSVCKNSENNNLWRYIYIACLLWSLLGLFHVIFWIFNWSGKPLVQIALPQSKEDCYFQSFTFGRMTFLWKLTALTCADMESWGQEAHMTHRIWVLCIGYQTVNRLQNKGEGFLLIVSDEKRFKKRAQITQRSKNKDPRSLVNI